MKIQKLNYKQAQQTLYLLRFDFTLKHVPEMKKTNELSRRLGQKVEEKENENQKLIKEEQIYILVEVIIKEIEVDIIEKNKNNQRKKQGSNQSSKEDDEDRSKNIERG